MIIFSTIVDWKRLKQFSRWQIVTVVVERTRNPRCLLEWYASAPNLPACIMTKNQRTTSRPARVLLWTVETPNGVYQKCCTTKSVYHRCLQKVSTKCAYQRCLPKVLHYQKIERYRKWYFSLALYSLLSKRGRATLTPNMSHVECAWTQIRKISLIYKNANEFQNCLRGPRSRHSFLSDMLPCYSRETS